MLKSRFKLTVKQYAATILWSIFIFILCALPSASLPNLSWLELVSPDKWAHASVFGILSLLARLNTVQLPIETLATIKAKFKNKVSFAHFLKQPNFVIILLCTLYGISIEFYQGFFTDDRMFDWFDALANTVGTFLGIWFYERYVTTSQFGQDSH
jgi:VanZ family protein